MRVSLNIEQAARAKRIRILTQDKRNHALPQAGITKNPEVKDIDWHDSSDRKWLMNHLHWAMNNNKSVELFPLS